METTDIDRKKLELSGKIDELIADLKRRFLDLSKEGPIGTGPDGKVGVWDRVKNWWNKLRYGKFGNLAQAQPDPNAEKAVANTEKPKSECIKFSLQEYRVLKDSCDQLNLVIEKNQESLNEEESDNLKNLKLFRIIDDWGNKFKQVILDLVYPDTERKDAQEEKSGGVSKQQPTIGAAIPVDKEKAVAGSGPPEDQPAVVGKPGKGKPGKGKPGKGKPGKRKPGAAPTEKPAVVKKQRKPRKAKEAEATTDPSSTDTKEFEFTAF